MTIKLSKLSPDVFERFKDLEWKCAACKQTVRMGQAYNHGEAEMYRQGTLKHPFQRQDENVVCLVCEKSVIKGRDLTKAELLDGQGRR